MIDIRLPIGHWVSIIDYGRDWDGLIGTIMALSPARAEPCDCDYDDCDEPDYEYEACADVRIDPLPSGHYMQRYAAPDGSYTMDGMELRYFEAVAS